MGSKVYKQGPRPRAFGCWGKELWVRTLALKSMWLRGFWFLSFGLLPVVRSVGLVIGGMTWFRA